MELLARATARGTLPPSLIFAGPEGVGKRLESLSSSSGEHDPDHEKPVLASAAA